MPSQNRKTDTADRPSSKARAANLRAQAARVMPAAPAVTSGQPAPATTERNSALAALIAEHRALIAGHNNESHPDPVADALFDRAYARFREACAIPAGSLADLRAKFDMVEPELREAVEALGPLATCALDSLSADIWRLAPTEGIVSPLPPASDYDGLPDPRTVTAALPVEALPLSEMAALTGAIETIRNVADAVLCQPLCIAEQRGELVTHNAAGRFVDWLTTALGRTLDRAHDHARQLKPGSEKEAEIRISVLGYPDAICGDANDMRAYASDLLALANCIDEQRAARG